MYGATVGIGGEWRGMAWRGGCPARLGAARDTKADGDVRMARDSLAPLRAEWRRLREVISYGGNGGDV